MWPKVLGKLFKSHKRSAGWHIGLTCTCIVQAIHHFRNVLQRRVDLPKERSCSIKNSTSLSVTLLILCLVLVCERERVNNIEHTKVTLPTNCILVCTILKSRQDSTIYNTGTFIRKKNKGTVICMYICICDSNQHLPLHVLQV